ncbi:LAME_0B00122g1_1 [Lachancea meyersii CBS 8951]|uniref:LAME_0B00122g1_1 n=1 Tax=Lachancea meyersii CBS 8951 TaxID=1266667 RepID=A0A1G4IS79_9SACH|nr:LAME_0B00122g1_1 [Lachancea meyersii CBS 8951]
MCQTLDKKSTINLFKGYASHDLLPRQDIIEATSEVLLPEKREYDDKEEDRHPLVYGSDSGSLWVRACIADFSNKAFKLPTHSTAGTRPEHLNLTSGASYGIMNILLQTTLPHTGYTKQAFIVTPTYFLVNKAFLDAGFTGKITAVEEKGDGLDLAFLEAKLESFENTTSVKDVQEIEESLRMIDAQEGKKKIFKYVIYLVPTYSNPTGAIYSRSCRLKLLELARKYDILIISDDVYDLLRLDNDVISGALSPGPPELRFPHLDRQSISAANMFGNTVSNCTFSKIIAPGLRTGYQETANANLATQLASGGANRSGGTPCQLNSMIVATMIKNGAVERIINDFVSALRERARVLAESIKTYLPEGTQYSECRGGYFSWCTLPVGYDSSKIVEELRLKGVLLADGLHFEVTGDKKNWGERSVRLSISYATAAEIQEAVKRWGQVCERYRPSNSKGSLERSCSQKNLRCPPPLNAKI